MMFTLAMVENPSVWKRAQVDIDTVVGAGRLPEFSDRVSLPYIDAILREVLRWGLILPLGECREETNPFSQAFLNVEKAFHGRSHMTMYTGVITYQKVCPIVVYTTYP